MVDFIKKITTRPFEIVEVAGEKVEVRGLSVGEIENLRKQYKGDEDAIGLAMVCACCFVGGKQVLSDATIKDIMPEYLNALAMAVGRVNGHKSGNSKATGGEGSSSD